MTAPTLPDTLARLAQLLPERVGVVTVSRQIVGNLTGPLEVIQTISVLAEIEVHYQGENHVVMGEQVSPLAPLALEAALREECGVRGWRWVTENCDFPHLPPYRVSLLGFDRRWRQVRYADTPAHALALALLSALGGEGT